MDKADAASDTISAPPSPSSTTSAHVERSLSPESSCQESTTPKASKASRKLICFNCNVTQTPLWRRTPDRRHSLCNACGLYYKQYGAHRPLNALLRPAEQKITPPLMTAKQGIECANCSQTQTPLWRKNDAGEPICNACGLYAKLHKRARPVTMRKSKISRRRR
ncbi:MAG: GATA zinc finger-domain-containing protein, partial [Linnemannia gamsii]